MDKILEAKIEEQYEKFLLLDYLLNHDKSISTSIHGKCNQMPITFIYASPKADNRYWLAQPYISVNLR